MNLLTWKEIKEKVYVEPPFLLDPYITRGGITLLFGDTSVGKSPVTWEMARAIAVGESFYGLPTTKGRVLYLEVDTPEVVFAPRLKLIPIVPDDVWFLIVPGGLSVGSVVTPEEMTALRDARDIAQPDVVFLNTLRKLHDEDDRESRVPKRVYSFFQKMFPGAALVVVHHSRKVPLDPRLQEVDKEKFSGSKHWINDAQVGLLLATWNSRRENLRLYHVKSQASELLKPLPLKLHKDGTTLTSPRYDELLFIYESIAGGSSPKVEVDRAAMAKFGISASTAKRRRLEVEHNLFPGSRKFLSPNESEEEE